MLINFTKQVWCVLIGMEIFLAKQITSWQMLLGFQVIWSCPDIDREIMTFFQMLT